MQIMLNGEGYFIEHHSTTVAVVLENQKITSFAGIAVAVNNQVVPKTQWNEYTLNENDQVLIITATQGG